jgi:hypothetical protein
VFGAACQFSEGGRLVRGRRARASPTTPPGPILAAAAGAIRPRVCSAPRRLPRGGTRAAAAVREDFCCARCCLCFSPLPRAVLLLCSKSFAARGAACDSARCGAAVAHEVFCCGRGYLFFSALLRAVPLLCARVLFAIKERAKRQAAPGAGVLFICTKAPVSDCH